MTKLYDDQSPAVFVEAVDSLNQCRETWLRTLIFAGVPAPSRVSLMRMESDLPEP